MMPPGIRIAVDGQGKDERFIIVEFPEEPKSKGHFMSTSAPMTETEFRSWLVSGGISDVLIEETIAGARAASKKAT